MSDFSLDPALSALTVVETVSCPYCWESIDLIIDLSVADQSYVEDCAVCCRPIVVSCRAEDGQLNDVSVRPENE